MEINPIKLEILKKFGTQEKFSIASGVNESIVSKILRGTRRPSDQQKQRFSLLLGVPVEKLFGESHEQHS